MFKFYDFIRDMGLPVSEHISPENSCLIQHRYLKERYQIEESSKERIFHYLTSNVLKRQSFGDVGDAQAVIAFSFGDSDCVNQQLANHVALFYHLNPLAFCYVQQEIAKHLHQTPYVPIKNDRYQTTADVAKKAREDLGKVKVAVVAQSWHAQRCIETCESLGFTVVALKVSDGFPSQDPQPWVRNPINWIIKESHREVATGYEVSEQFNLI